MRFIDYDHLILLALHHQYICVANVEFPKSIILIADICYFIIISTIRLNQARLLNVISVCNKTKFGNDES